jgi:hypothetical protein
MAIPARESVVVVKEAEKVVGGRCTYCAIIVRSKALSGTLLPRHVMFGCKGGTGGRVQFETRGRIWDVTSPFTRGCGPQIRSPQVPGSPRHSPFSP